MSNAAGNIGVFLVETLFGLYILIVMLRLLLALVRADFYNPLSQFIVTATNPPLTALRRVLPSIGRVDTAAIVLLLVLKVAELWLITAIIGQDVSFGVLLVVAVVRLAKLVVYVFIGAIIIQIVLSWIAPGIQNPIVSVTQSLSQPLLQPVRRLMPRTGMIDLSPLIVIIALNIALILLGSIVP